MQLINNQLLAAKHAATALQMLSNQQRQELTHALANSLIANLETVLAANLLDVNNMEPNDPMRDRLLLTVERIQAIAQATHNVAALPDPVGKQLQQHRHADGFLISKITVPLGVVGAIYEARPNVTIDIAALCIRSGNVAVLKGGTAAAHTNLAIVTVLQQALQAFNLPKATITLLPNDRQSTTTMLQACQYIDVIVPRGSQQLIEYVRKNAVVPVIETGAGVCHTYVHAQAQLPMAVAIVVNAKVQRPSVCNSLDTVLIDGQIAAEMLPLLAKSLMPFGVGLYADEVAFDILNNAGYTPLYKAAESDFGREFLSLQASVKLVDGLADALKHIAQYSSKHSECIVTESQTTAAEFLQKVDAAAVYHNVSTRFTDGAEFGLGAELGISTQKLHARGPFALNKLVCEKWIVTGNGQTRS